MATPLFRPTLEEAFEQFLSDVQLHSTKTMLDQTRDVLDYFRQFLEQEGALSLPDPLKPRWEEARAHQQRFVQTFHTPQLLPAVPGFLQDLAYQKSVLPPGMVTNAEKTLWKLGRWLLARELASEQDYLTALEAMPHYEPQIDQAEELSSRLFDISRDDPPLGKVLDELRGYVEITRVIKGGLNLMPIHGTERNIPLRMDVATSNLAQSGWWIDAHLVQTPQGWQLLDVGNILP